jgi:hypothetical protein
MAITLSSTTPAAVAGSKNVAWQKDGSGNVSGEFSAPVAFGVYNQGVGSTAQVLLVMIPTAAIAFPSGATNSSAVAGVAATGSTTFTFKKNGTSFATCVFAASGTSGTFTLATLTAFNGTSDILEIDGPGTADATLANFSLVLAGYRT